MRRLLYAVPVVLVAAVAGFLILKPSDSEAQANKQEPSSKLSSPRLPISQVILFSSGVGYFQREGHVEGSARIDLSFPVNDINDLLKSMVLQDMDGGHISAVSYDSHDPIDRTLKSFAVNLTSNPTYGQILNQARGEKVEVVLQQSNTTQPGTMTGTIVGVEKQRQQVGKDAAIETEVLNLWCAEGLRACKLTDVQRVRFLNPTMDNEIKQALETLALSHDTQKKAVSVNFAGEGKRNVKVSYVIENPIWKTSYRLVLGKDGKPFLQGWAVVENPTDEDWRDVRMALISGRPISFQMDLYQPLYVPRPMVEPELFASLRPQTYTGGGFGGGPGLAGAAPASPPADTPVRQTGLGQKGRGLAAEAKAGDSDKDGLAREMEKSLRFRDAGDIAKKMSEEIKLNQGVQSAATAASLGDFFQYVIDHPVQLPRQKSAMLPIVNKNIEGSKVSIYNERTLNKHPLLGLKFKNTSGLHLMQGPITVFEGSNYAGDARVLDIQPNEERLISYAIDLGTEAQVVPHHDNGRLTAVKIQKGILHTTTKFKESKTYNFKNRSEQERLVVLEHPFRSDFKLTSAEKPVETARDVYRFELKLPAGKEAKQVISEERDISSQMVLTNSDDNSMRIIINDKVTSEPVKKALERAIELKWKLSLTQQEIANANRELNIIKQDQPRLRSNLEKIPGTDPLAKRILEKLNAQETDIEKFEAQLKKLNAQADQQRKDYEGYLASLNVE